MVVCLPWSYLKKILLCLSIFSFLLGLALLTAGPAVSLPAYIFLTLGSILLLNCILGQLLKNGCRLAPVQSPGVSGSARDNEAFEVPAYETAVELEPTHDPQGQGDPPPYSMAIALDLENQPSHLEAPRRVGLRRRGASEGSLTQGQSFRTSLSLPRAASTEPDLQSLENAPKPEPLTPPPAYEVGFNQQNQDSVFFQDNWAPP